MVPVIGPLVFKEPSYDPAKDFAPVTQVSRYEFAFAVVRERLLALGLEPTGTTPEALAAIMAADTARWAPIIKAAGFSAE